jgi:hypothetical protein
VDESTVREHAEAHGKAVAAGDLRTAGSDLTEEGRADAGAVMSKMPTPVTSATITSVTQSGDTFVATIRYEGTDGGIDVNSTWVEKDGRPMISKLALA